MVLSVALESTTLRLNDYFSLPSELREHVKMKVQSIFQPFLQDDTQLTSLWHLQSFDCRSIRASFLVGDVGLAPT